MVAAFEKIVTTSQFVLGATVEQFEKELAEYCTCDYAVGISSGTDALIVALMAIDLKPGDEVITSPFTFFATAGSIARLGGVPVFVDIDPVSFNMNPALIEKAITPRTRAIMPVHLFGQCADMDAINAIARRYGLRVIEDAAQAIGATFAGQPAGTMGDIGCLSFYPTKNLSACGDAGACTTDSEPLYRRLKSLRLHGESATRYYHDEVGGNFRIDALQAAMLSIKMPFVEQWTEARRANAAAYNRLLAGSAVVTPTELPRMRHVYHQYTVRVPAGKRDALKAHLAARKVGFGVFYPVPLHLQKCFAYLGGKAGDFPHAERAANEVISLPIYPGLTDAQLQEVASAIRDFTA